MQPLTIIYLTVRKDPKIEWFIASLRRERLNLGAAGPEVSLVVVDHFNHDKARVGGPVRVVAPKPNVWNGQTRLTKEEWFNAASARNTGLCYVETKWVAFVDDLSVLMPGWLGAAMEATKRKDNFITLGAYRKVKKMRVDADGHVTTHEFFPAGVDNRQKHVDPELTAKRVVPCAGNWLYGCSLIAPLEAFLAVNGWCEDFCGGIGFEDCVTGLVLERAGYKFVYDTRLMSWESEEDHHAEPPFKKTDKGVSPKDKSHAVLERVASLTRFDNGFDLRAMRADALAGKPFPIPTAPTHDWFDGQPIAEM